MRYRTKDGAVWRQVEILLYLDMQDRRCMKLKGVGPSRAASGCGDVAGPVALVDCNNF